MYIYIHIYIIYIYICIYIYIFTFSILTLVYLFILDYTDCDSILAVPFHMREKMKISSQIIYNLH